MPSNLPSTVPRFPFSLVFRPKAAPTTGGARRLAVAVELGLVTLVHAGGGTLCSRQSSSLHGPPFWNGRPSSPLRLEPPSPRRLSTWNRHSPLPSSQAVFPFGFNLNVKVKPEDEEIPVEVAAPAASPPPPPPSGPSMPPPEDRRLLRRFAAAMASGQPDFRAAARDPASLGFSNGLAAGTCLPCGSSGEEERGGAPLYTVASDALDQPQAAAVSARVGGVDWGSMCGWEFPPCRSPYLFALDRLVLDGLLIRPNFIRCGHQQARIHEHFPRLVN